MKIFGVPPKDVWILWIFMLLSSSEYSVRAERRHRRMKFRPSLLNLQIYPEERIIHRNAGEDAVITCRDEGTLRADVSWRREDNEPFKSGVKDRSGRLEIYDLTVSDSGTFICQATKYSEYPESKKTVQLIVDETPYIGACPSDSATCSDGTCIKKTSMCDGFADCSDGLDEDICGSSCEPNEFRCANGKCVLKAWLCDGEDDCGDNSDEAYCNPSSSPLGECLPNEFKCDVGGQIGGCVPKSFHCDGQSDCLNGSDELYCEEPNIVKPPTPKSVTLNSGQNLRLECEATGVPPPVISWRLNTSRLPDNCISTSEKGVGVLTCQNVQTKNTGAYSCEANNNINSKFASPDAIVYVNDAEVCPDGLFNREALSGADCVPCFCFGQSTQCQSANLFEYKMAATFTEEDNGLRGVDTSDGGINVQQDQFTCDNFDYFPFGNGAMVTRLESLSLRSSFNSIIPYISLPNSFNGNHLKSYGGFIRYKIVPHSPPTSWDEDNLPYVIIKGKYRTLVHYHTEKEMKGNIFEARLTDNEHWNTVVHGRGSFLGKLTSFPLASREDVMMTLSNIEMILLRATVNGEGVNISDFSMSSAGGIDMGTGTANLVEECTCPPGYEGLSCQDCTSGYVRSQPGPWLGNCVPSPQPCQPGFYREDVNSTCIPCPCPSGFQNFASSCSVGPNGSVVCNCKLGYGGELCKHCDLGYEGNPQVIGGSCKPVLKISYERHFKTILTSDVIVKILGSPLITKEVGGSVNLTCEAHSLSPYSRTFPIEWWKVDEELPHGRYLFDSRTGLLLITNLQLSDSGNYICTTQAGNTGEAIANLKVVQGTDLQTVTLQDVTVTINLPKQIVEKGSTVNFTCQAFHQATSTRLPMLWTKEEGGLPHKRHQVDWQTGSLLISNVQLSDSGTYTCHVYDESNDITKNAELKILSPTGQTRDLEPSLPNPSIEVKITSPSLVTQYLGENYNFTCEAHSWTSSTLSAPSQHRLPMTWIKIGGELPKSHRIDEKNGLLLLNNLQISDSGMYACISSDGINVAQDLATLQIKFDIEIRY